MLVCVDHGNKQIKTASRVFTSGLVESDTRPLSVTTSYFIGGNTTRSPTSESPIPGIKQRTTDFLS